MKIAYLVTCCNETITLRNLLKRLDDNVPTDDEIFIVCDESNTNTDTQNIIVDFANNLKNREQIVRCWLHPLNNNYGAHKNMATEMCSETCDPRPDFFFQIDGDELPSENIIGENLHSIIELNEGVELIYVPRINDFRRVTEDHAKQWGWRLDNSPTYNRPRVNFPDYQSRIYRNVPDRIKWDRALHEKIVGHDKYSFLPAEEEYALYHDKTIERQLETNLRYNKNFSEADNKGHNII